MGTAPYGYSYDNIGNRKTAQEIAEELTYTANNLNQYTRIEESGETPFVPTYDASGNQTLIKTSTGIWTVVYNAANRAVSFTSRDGNIVVECGYDYQGRRYMKKVTVNGTVASHERYLYRGYLQIAALDMLNSKNVHRTLLWDPLEPVATRPLALVQENALYCYGMDFNKDVTEVFAGEGAVAATYDYSPYGTVTGTGNLVQPVQWSSEMNDHELALVYYNYRYYNPADGRWINRDPIAEEGGWNLYGFVGSNSILETDILGTAWSSLQTEAGAALAARQAAEAAAKAAARAAGTAIAAERSKKNKRCAELYREKSEAKKEARGSSCKKMIIPECPTQDECNIFNDRYEKMKRFAEARKAYDDECYQGGDAGHQKQREGWFEGAQNCKSKYDECITKINQLV